MATTVFTTLYSENLFGCFDDFGICVYGYFCTPCLVGQSVEDAGQGKCFDIAYQISLCYLVPYCGPFLAMQRAGEAMNKAARAYGITDDVPCCPTAVFCGACAACRLQREIIKRRNAGLQPAQPAVMMAVPAAQMMIPQQVVVPKV